MIKIKIFQKIFSHFQVQLLCSFLLCTLLPLLIIGGISYGVSYKIARSSILDASFSSDTRLNMQLDERLEQVEQVADSLQYDMYSLFQTQTVQEYLEAFTNTRNDLSLFKTTFNFYHACIFLPSDYLGSGKDCTFFLHRIYPDIHFLPDLYLILVPHLYGFYRITFLSLNYYHLMIVPATASPAVVS